MSTIHGQDSILTLFEYPGEPDTLCIGDSKGETLATTDARDFVDVKNGHVASVGTAVFKIARYADVFVVTVDTGSVFLKDTFPVDVV